MVEKSSFVHDMLSAWINDVVTLDTARDKP
jgi:hypothetical protein